MVLRLAPWGVGVFDLVADGGVVNVTEVEFSQAADEVRRLRQVSWCVTVVVVSDDPAFLTSFAEWASYSGLMVRLAKLLAITHLPLRDLQDLRATFSMMNALLLIVDDTSEPTKCGVFMHLPYSRRDSQELRIAWWTPHLGLVFTTHLPLFHDKFSRFPHRPSLRLTTEVFPTQRAVMVDDSEAPGGKRLSFIGPMANVADFFARRMNFTYTYVRSPDREWGIKKEDGSWSGMVGLVSREEAAIGLGPIVATAARAEVVDFTSPLSIISCRILGRQGRPEVDPWGFLLPLDPLVWLSILMALLAAMVLVFFASSAS
ncbi:glutamate receptor ionotropic, delta-2-like [Panulirus ornatus]|uniref:glutamate receptor ionotropic, delta-2-like n=1 Tax=Panulirus ornatus TaxID=150431 RepID=UPI003A84EC5C